MLEDSFRLLSGDSREPLEELFESCAGLEILEQRRDGHARAPEYPGAAHPVGAPPTCRALRPVQHRLHPNKEFVTGAPASPVRDLWKWPSSGPARPDPPAGGMGKVDESPRYGARRPGYGARKEKHGVSGAQIGGADAEIRCAGGEIGGAHGEIGYLDGRD